MRLFSCSSLPTSLSPSILLRLLWSKLGNDPGTKGVELCATRERSWFSDRNGLIPCAVGSTRKRPSTSARSRQSPRYNNLSPLPRINRPSPELLLLFSPLSPPGASSGSGATVCALCLAGLTDPATTSTEAPNEVRASQTAARGDPGRRVGAWTFSLDAGASRLRLWSGCLGGQRAR